MSSSKPRKTLPRSGRVVSPQERVLQTRLDGALPPGALRRTLRRLRLVLASLLTFSCTGGPAVESTDLTGDLRPGDAVAHLEARSGSEVDGIIRLGGRSAGVVFEGEVRGLPPGSHALHVHTVGDCSAEDGRSSGFPYSARLSPPADLETPGPADGHLGYLVTDEKGVAHVERMTDELSLQGAQSLLGRALVIHDAETEGPAIACGVIRPAEVIASSE